MSPKDPGDRNLDPDFEDMFKKYYPAVVVLFQRWRFSQPESEQLAQETFLKVHQGLARYQPETGRWTWIWAIAANVYRNELRRRKTQRRRGLEVSLERPSGDGESTAELRREISVPARQVKEVAARQDLRREVADLLPPRMREVFRLRMVAGWTYDEIARETNVSVQTVKAQIHQARQRLLNHLKRNKD